MEEPENCWEYFIVDGTARRLLLGRTTLRRLVIVPDNVCFRVGITGKLGTRRRVKQWFHSCAEGATSIYGLHADSRPCPCFILVLRSRMIDGVGGSS